MVSGGFSRVLEMSLGSQRGILKRLKALQGVWSGFSWISGGIQGSFEYQRGFKAFQDDSIGFSAFQGVSG